MPLRLGKRLPTSQSLALRRSWKHTTTTNASSTAAAAEYSTGMTGQKQHRNHQQRMTRATMPDNDARALCMP